MYPLSVFSPLLVCASALLGYRRDLIDLAAMLFHDARRARSPANRSRLLRNTSNEKENVAGRTIPPKRRVRGHSSQPTITIMGKIEAETCSVCKENPSKYRCPGCAAPYCSLACNKAHKAGSGSEGEENYYPPCTGKRAGAPLAPNGNSSSSSQQSTAKRPRAGEGINSSGKEGGAVEEGGATTTACVRKGRDQWRGGREDREEEEWQMSSDQMKRISGCAWLKAALRDPKLQGLLVSGTCYQARSAGLTPRRR